MDRPSIYPVYTVLLALGLSLGLGSWAQARITYDNSPLPRLVATVITLSPRGLATLRSSDGALYQVLKGTGWRVGDTVECEQYDIRTQGTQLQLDCRKVS
jgi:hypothetical protein